MTHILSMYDNKYIYAFDLKGRPAVVTMDRVAVGKLGKEQQKKPILYFVGKERGLALNKTNARTIIGMYGPDVEKWRGKRITLFPTTCESFGSTVECIRIRPEAPKGNAKDAPPDLDAEREPGADDVAEGEAA
jgi:hypothetical protein